jgi:hypothetical protein
MSNRRFLGTCVVLALVLTALLARPNGSTAAAGKQLLQIAFENAAGESRTIYVGDKRDLLDNPFFQELGTNRRSCVSCHQPAEGWSITPEGVQKRFVTSYGTDPIFRTNDGSNCEGALPGSIAEKRDAYSLLLTRGLIRVGLELPANAEFTVDAVSDPSGCAPAAAISMHRRPLPSTNIRFLSAVMWDGRESFSTTTIEEDLLRQANNATRGHAEAFFDITPAQATAIVEFEMGLFTAQSRDNAAGNLHAGASGGPRDLPSAPFFIGINDPIGLNPSGAPFEPQAFTLFDGWSDLPASAKSSVIRARRAIARGQAIFNSKPIVLTGVSGLNNETFPNGVTVPDSLTGTCTVCHDSPNVGNHSVKAPLDIGLSDPAIAPYLPVYTLRRISTGETVQTTDPGRAVVSGRWQDINRFKGPILRGLAARAPYFHNGAAATLEEVVEFYETRFDIGLTPQEKADLAAFLRAL